MNQVRITFREGGSVEAIYHDDLVPVFDALGGAQTRRASHVEPWRYGGWFADMSASGGPRILLPHFRINSLNEVVGRPSGFTTRQAALDAEVAWLREHRGL